MSEPVYLFVGGPWDGRRFATGGLSTWNVPLAPEPLLVFGRKLVPFRDPFGPSFSFVPYYRVGNVYRYQDLIEDAYVELDVSDKILVEAGSLIRREIRHQMRRKLEGLANGRELGRIVWRVSLGRRPFVHTFKAIVGPRRMERGLTERRTRLPIERPSV